MAAKTKAELMKEKMEQQRVGKAAFETGSKPIIETQIPEPAPVVKPSTEELTSYAVPSRTQGRKGQKTPRMNLAIPEDVYEFVRRQSRKEGLTYSEFFCALARQYQKQLGE